MKQELLNLIDEKDKILALAHEENSFMNISFVVYDVPEFISWKEKVRAELVSIPNKNDTIIQTIEVIDNGFKGWHDKTNFHLLCGKLMAIKASIDSYYEGDIKDMPGRTNTKVFIVHGHDVDRRNEVELFMRRIGLTPVIL